MSTHPEGGGDGVPKSDSEHVEYFPTGEVRLDCEEPPVDGVGSDYATLGVVDSGGLYKPVELECEGGMTVGMEAPLYAPESRERKVT